MIRFSMITRSGLMILRGSPWLILFAGVTVLVNSSTARATTIYVNAICGDDAKTGTSPNCTDPNGPKLTIQDAINTAIDTDEIEVAPGTYNEVIDFIGKAITLRSTDPRDPVVVAVTIINGTGLNNSVVKCVSGEGANTVLNGFTITGGTGSICGEFVGNNCGGGMYNLGSSPTIINCTFSGNATNRNGGGMYNEASSPTVTSCSFNGNSAGGSGGGMLNDSGSPIVNNCTFSGNIARVGAGMSNSGSSPVVANCTFIGNMAGNPGVGGMYSGFSSSSTVINSIFWGNSDLWGYRRTAQILNAPDSQTTVSYSCVQDRFAGDGNVIAGVGNIDADPLVVDFEGPDGVPGTGDENLSLLPGSPCIDSGDNSAVPSDTRDIDGDLDTDEPFPVDLLGRGRFIDDLCTPDSGSQDPAYASLGIVDMGAIEYQEGDRNDPDGDGLVGCADNCPLHSNPDQADCDGSGMGDYCALELGASRDCNGNGIPDECDIANGTSTDAEDNGVPDECQRVYYVDDDAEPGQDGLTWATALTHLQDALAVAWLGDEIRVAEGIYLPDRSVGSAVIPGDRDATFQLSTGVVINGGYRGCPSRFCGAGHPGERDIKFYETILSGDLAADDAPVSDPAELLKEPTRSENSYHVTTSIGVDETAVLNGFTITGGSSLWRCGGAMNNRYGGSPTIIDCNFSGNAAFRGGAMCNLSSSNPTLVNCEFSNNSALWGGGGMSNYDSSSVVTNCSFTGNTAEDGGGMYNFAGSNPVVKSCTFTGNSSVNRGGGIYNENSSPTVTGCTLIGNTAESGGGMYNVANSSPTVTSCSFIRNSATDGDGGGMYNLDECTPTVTLCTFTENTGATLGGGLCNDNSNATVANCVFHGNQAMFGGGMYSRYSSPRVTGCTFVGNVADASGGGLFSFSDVAPMVVNSTFSGNIAGTSGGGLHNAANVRSTVTECIFWGNLPDGFSNYYHPVLVSPLVSYSDVQGGLPAGSVDGGGNIDVDPLFVRNPDDGGDGWGDDPETVEIDEGANDDYGDLRLLSGSLCINAGDPAFVPEPGETDLDGHSRMLCGRVDMGAYEFGIGDFDCSDVVDLIDFTGWSSCMTGPDGGPYGAGCEAFDFDADLDVDQQDYAAFARALSAP